MNKFKELGIHEDILKVIEEEHFDEPTEIQDKSIPLILSGRDIIGGSATGSGKTLAFGTGIITTCEKGKGIQAIVLTPTRELTLQVTESMKKFSKYKKLVITPIYGGVSINPQIQNLNFSDVVVGTPGRVLDHLQRGTMDLSNVKIAVLDEADRMLDMGFIDDVKKIISQCPRSRQTLLFSATISTDIHRLAKNYLNNPVKIAVESYVDPSLLRQVYYEVPMNMKFSLLVHFLNQERPGLVMVFCNTQRITDYVAKNLTKQGIDAIPIHGGLSQAKRTRTLERFHDGKALVLVCTDVAARGLHIENVSHIYNYDIPRESKQYIHRIGRTARAGKEGIAVNILTQRDHENFNWVLRDNEVDIERMETPKVEKIMIEGLKKRFNRGYRGQRHGERRNENVSGGRKVGHKSRRKYYS